MFSCLVALTLWTQDPAAPKQPSYWVPMAKEYLADVRVAPLSDPASPYQRQPEPIFHHIQSVRGKSVGSVFLYLEPSGRPAAVSDVFFLTSKRTTMYNEFHSLSQTPLSVRGQSTQIATCPGPGVVWKEIPEAGMPGMKPAERTRQIGGLSRRFTAYLINRAQDRYELRLLAKPLHRFDTTDTKECLGGALLVFCQETDPEIFLLIEARKVAEGYRWMYAPAQFSDMNLFLQLDATEVWSANPPQFDRSGPHWGGPIREVMLPMPEENADGK
jgi:hypothetical protein